MKTTIITIVIFALACYSNDTEKKIKPSEHSQLEKKLDTLFNSKIEQDEPGAAVLVSFDGEMIIGKGYGVRDIESKAPITKSTNMRIASLSKQFTALTILQLVDEGKLSLSDSVFTYFPFETFKDGTTIEQLINHHSGKQDAESAFFREWDRSKIAVNEDIANWYTVENRTVNNPGEKFEYNNGIYEFLPCIVEKVSGKDFATFAKEKIFTKAKMMNSNFFNLTQPIEISEKAFCYERDDQGVWQKKDGHYLNGLLGAGGLYTSINDYFEYDQALRNNTIFSKATHDIIFEPSATFDYNDEERSYAMGWFVTDTTATHTGGWFGTNTYAKRYLDKPLTIAIFMNRNTLFEGGLINKTDSLVIDHINSLRN